MTRTSNPSIDSNYPSHDSSDFPQQPLQNQQLGFMTALHPDIILVIFSFLSQKDCLACMAVCRDWYHTVPQYAQDKWKTLRLGEHDARNENQRQIRCLGRHVKNVVLDAFSNEQELYYTMHKLADWGCTEIESLEFNGCDTKDQDALLGALEKLAPYLTHLEMLNHGSNIAFLHVFKACPELTHFTYWVNMRLRETTSNIYDTEPTVNQTKDLPLLPRATKITHLCLDAPMENQTRLYPILRNCPNLRCFIGPSCDTLEFAESTQPSLHALFPNDIDYLFELCPKINYVQALSFQEDAAYNMRNADIYTSNHNCTGIRYLKITESFGQERITRYLTKNQDTLEYLSIEGDTDDSGVAWPSLFSSLRLTQLHTLVLHYCINLDTRSLVIILNDCPTLEKLDMRLLRPTYEFDVQCLRSLRTLTRLRSLSISPREVSSQSLTVVLDRCPALEELFLSCTDLPLSLPTCFRTDQLKHLSLERIKWVIDDHVPDIDEAAARYVRSLTARSKLETVHVCLKESIGPKIFLAIAGIQTLKYCDIKLDEGICHNEDAMLEFARTLSRTAIEFLKLHCNSAIPSGFLAALGKLRSLKGLYLSLIHPNIAIKPPCKVDGSDLLQLLHEGTKLASVYLYGVTLNNSKPIHDEVKALINQEAQSFYIYSNKKHRIPEGSPSCWASLRFEVAIKRISSY